MFRGVFPKHAQPYRNVFEFAVDILGGVIVGIVEFQVNSQICFFEILGNLRDQVGDVGPDSFINFGKYNFSFYFAVLPTHNLHLKSPQPPPQKHGFDRGIVDVVEQRLEEHLDHWEFRENLVF